MRGWWRRRLVKYPPYVSCVVAECSCKQLGIFSLSLRTEELVRDGFEFAAGFLG